MFNFYYCCVFISAFSALIMHVDALIVNANINTDNLRGSNAALTCSWVKEQPSEALFKLVIGAQPDLSYYVILIGQNVPPINTTSSQSDRLSLDTYAPTTNSITMRISDLQCVDEKTYVCSVEYYNVTAGTTGNQIKNATQTLGSIKIAPRQPTKTTVPTSLLNGIEENNDVSVTCTANIGRSGRGRLAWKVFRGTNAENIDASDQRITSSTGPPQGDEDSCTMRMTQTFKMKATRADQELVISCFVLNDDFPPSALPASCGNSLTDRCAQTEKIMIYYGVTKVTVTRDPQTQLYVGGSVILKCFSDSFPSPTYTWVKVDDVNRELNAEISDSISQVKLNFLDDTADGGDYNCTASNNFNGKNFSDTDSVNISIEQTTTPLPTTTPMDVSTEPSTGGAHQQTGDDGDDTRTILIIVFAVLGGLLLLAAIVGFLLWRRRNARKEIEEPPEKPYNNRTNLSHHSGQPDLVADDKKFHNSSLNNSFDMKNEDGLMYADLTYDNRPRSRKPMAINDAASDYSDIQMPQV